MKKICIPLANGFEEVEAVTIIDICRRAEIEVTIAGVEGLNISGSHNIKVTADTEIQNINPNEFDMIVLPGGLPGAETLANNPIVQKILKEQKSKNGHILVQYVQHLMPFIKLVFLMVNIPVTLLGKIKLI